MFYQIQSGYPESVNHLPIPHMALIEPLILVALSVLFWFMSYKDEEGHLIAFCIGFFIIVPALGAGISEAIHGQFYRNDEELARWYIGISHVLYGLVNIREVLEGLGQDAR
ncbi:MAG: hypothetical protein ABW087_18140 [Candidatus Thiodiazotropha sp.]